MTIELTGLELHGFHGVLESERRDGQRFLIDVRLELADTTAAVTDRLEDALDYRDVVTTVVSVSESRAFFLLEALAETLAEALLERFRVHRVRVRVRKPDVRLALPLEHAAVVVEKP